MALLTSALMLTACLAYIQDALKALGLAHNKLLAAQAPLDPNGGPSAYGVNGSRQRKFMTESGRPTTLSMIKSGLGNRNEGTRDKIAMMEAKLRQMEKSKPTQNANASASSLPFHTSLPAKPLPSPHEPQRQPQRRPPPPLPSLPLMPPGSSEPKGLRMLSGGSKSSNTTARKSGTLVGDDHGGAPLVQYGDESIQQP
ncbi:hypothetical protein K438DRAFT_1882121 [Mycena galopus ATCC 62051]|nr:hypothetical protein K438DRAFT_1882121 [Mycena galopus ATCC 62051]